MGESNRSVVAALLVVAVAAASVARSWWFWTAHTPTLQPDTSLYTMGGSGLFPSPIGRLLGNAGVEGLAAVNVIAGGLLVLLVAVAAHRLGGNPVLASVVCLLTPLSYWMVFAGVDTLAACLVVAAGVSALPSRPRGGHFPGHVSPSPSGCHLSVSAGSSRCPRLIRRLEDLFTRTRAARFPGAAFLYLTAVATHLSLAPAFAVEVARRSPRRALIVCVPLGLVLVVTPYGGVVGSLLSPWEGLRCAALTLALVCLPYLVAPRRFYAAMGVLWPLAAGTALAAFLQSDGRLTNTRYGLPLAVALAIFVAVPVGSTANDRSRHRSRSRVRRSLNRLRGRTALA